MLTLTCDDFNDGDTIPLRFTCEGDNLSPAFRWTGLPKGTRDLLLTCTDPDAPRGTFHHWAVCGIAPDASGLPPGFGAQSVQSGIRQAVNDFGKPGYGGPCPPRGHNPHRYLFRLSALREPIAPGPGATCADIIALARPHVIEWAELVGRFGRS